jgi:hypothetical protein
MNPFHIIIPHLSSILILSSHLRLRLPIELRDTTIRTNCLVFIRQNLTSDFCEWQGNPPSGDPPRNYFRTKKRCTYYYTYYYKVTYYFKFSPATACIWHSFYLQNLFHGRVLKPAACAELIRKAANATRITIIFKILRNIENKRACSNL